MLRPQLSENIIDAVDDASNESTLHFNDLFITLEDLGFETHCTFEITVALAFAITIIVIRTKYNYFGIS